MLIVREMLNYWREIKSANKKELMSTETKIQTTKQTNKQTMNEQANTQTMNKRKT